MHPRGQRQRDAPSRVSQCAARSAANDRVHHHGPRGNVYAVANRLAADDARAHRGHRCSSGRSLGVAASRCAQRGDGTRESQHPDAQRCERSCPMVRVVLIVSSIVHACNVYAPSKPDSGSFPTHRSSAHMCVSSACESLAANRSSTLQGAAPSSSTTRLTAAFPPVRRNSANSSGNPADNTLCAAASTSYGTRTNSTCAPPSVNVSRT